MLTLDIPLTEITHNQFQQSTLYTIKIKKRDFKAIIKYLIKQITICSSLRTTKGNRLLYLMFTDIYSALKVIIKKAAISTN